MVKFYFNKIFFLVFLLSCSNVKVLQSFNEKSKKVKGSYQLRLNHFLLSRDFVESFLQQHPIFSVGVACSVLGYYLYPRELAKFERYIQKHRHIFFAGGFASILLAYYHRDKLLNSVLSYDDLDNEDSSNIYLSMSKSGVKIYGPGEIKTTFQDVAGLQTAKEDLFDFLMFLKNPKKFTDIGAHVPKGLLLSGSPGNGKTLLARALAGEAECPFLYISASEIIEMCVGVGATRIRHLFSIAKDLAPCIIFIDEIDAIGFKRSSSGCSGESEYTQTLNQLLSEMDGFEQHKDPIVIIGATNRADVLDEALLRSGRFDRKIEVNSPYVKDRYEILKINFAKVKAACDINLEQLACVTVGFSGADLANLVNEAAILAIRENKSVVERHHIDQARDFMLLGRETKGMDISKEEMWKTAIHEAGHALARVYQKNAKPLYKVTITPRGGALGLTYGMEMKEQYGRTEEEIRAEIVVSLAGSVAEELMLNCRGVGARSDLEAARKLATQMVMWFGMTQEFKDITFVEFIHAQVHLPESIATKLQNEVSKIIEDCRAFAGTIIQNHKDELLELAEMLMQQGTLSGDDVYALCKQDLPELQFSVTV